MGKLVGHERIYDVRREEMLLKAHRPRQFAPEREQHLTISGGIIHYSPEKILETVRRLSPALAAIGALRPPVEVESDKVPQ